MYTFENTATSKLSFIHQGKMHEASNFFLSRKFIQLIQRYRSFLFEFEAFHFKASFPQCFLLSGHQTHRFLLISRCNYCCVKYNSWLRQQNDDSDVLCLNRTFSHTCINLICIMEVYSPNSQQNYSKSVSDFAVRVSSRDFWLISSRF